MNHPGERTVVVEGPPPPRTSPSLTRALRIVDAGPRYVYRAAVVSLAGTCVLAIGLALAIHPAGGLRRPQKEITEAGLAGLVLVALLTVAAMLWPAERRAAVMDRVAAREQRAAIWLALAVWFPLLLVPAYYRVKATLPTSVVWISFGFLDKRWVTATYLLLALAPMLLLVTAARVLAAGRGHPESWRAWLRCLAPAGRAGQADAAAAPERDGVPAVESSGWWGARHISTVLGILTAIALAYYFYGPPWYLTKTASTGSVGIGFQEDVFLSGFQAISKGAVPYIGPASVQYGPGAQLLSYLYMRHIGGFSVVGFRESWAMFEWVGATIFFVVLFLALGYGRGLAATLMSALIYPALQLMGFVSGHAYGGFFGWANPLRYVGAVSLILLLPAVIKRSPSWRGLTGAAVLGLLWGGLSYVAQENLIAGAIGALVVGALMLVSGTSSWRSLWTALAAVLGGFIVSWLPALVYYAVKGLLVRFVYLYFLITRAVAEGYSNTPYGGVHPHPSQIRSDAPWRMMFYDLPFLLAILALLAVVQFRPFRIAMEWSRQRIILVAVVVTAILMYQGALLRSDADHLTGTLLVVPALVIAVATILPRALGARGRVVLVVAGAAVVVASFALLPAKTYKVSSLRAEAAAPYRDRQRLAAAPERPAPATVAAERVGAGLTNDPLCCQRKNEPMGQFLALMDKVHAVVGNRTAYVASFRGGYPGIVYFVADLTPAPVPLDLHTMVFTAQQRNAYLATFRHRVLPHTQALLTTTLTGNVVRNFLQQYPHARTITLTYAGRPYYVLLAN